VVYLIIVGLGVAGSAETPDGHHHRARPAGGRAASKSAAIPEAAPNPRRLRREANRISSRIGSIVI
jgi:hypothetical protein